MRVESKRPVKNGGWLHPLDAKPGAVRPAPVVEEAPHINATAIMREFSAVTTRDMIEGLAKDLGVETAALIQIGAAWAARHHAWAFPMKDAYSNVIGIRLRDGTGRKWAVPGSRAGLFLGLNKISPMTCIMEGPTDTAAGLSIGLDAVGRPSCLGQEQMLCDRLRKSERVLIIADNDGPGLRGAEKLQSMLKCYSLIWCPPAKDLREFVRNGGTKILVEAMVKSLVWKRPQNA